MKPELIIPALLTILLAATHQIGAETYPTDWWSNRTADLNAYDDGGSETPRLDNAYDGYVEGTVVLPHDDTWEINFTVKADGEYNHSDDYVKIYINSNLVDSIPNLTYGSPPVWEYPVKHLISGDSFTYRFEMHSYYFPNHTHQQIGPGTINPVLLANQETQKITASDGSTGDSFGHSVGLSGNYAIAGAYKDDTPFSDSGSAYILEYISGTWTQIVKLTANDGNYHHFGGSVDISSDYAIVGAPHASGGGTVHIFERSGGAWIQAVDLTASDRADEDEFGISVSVDGNIAIVGAGLNDDTANNSGSAYIFERIDGVWTQMVKLAASDPEVNDSFGEVVSISGTYVIAGARNDDYGTDSGSAYIFEKIEDDWTEVAKLTVPDGATGDGFGAQVCISGNIAIVGATGNDDNGTDSGSAYIFERIGGSWTNVANLTPKDGSANDAFGTSVSAHVNYVVVGAYAEDENGADSGSAYLFECVSGIWSEAAKLIASDGASGDQFGIGIAITDGKILVGSRYDQDKGPQSGSAYFYSLGDLAALVSVETLHGFPSPAVGFHKYTLNTTITCSVDSVIIEAGTNYTCTGWIGTGSIPTSGTSNSTSAITLTNASSSITWNWTSNYWLTTATIGNGSIIPSTNWYAAGTILSISAEPDSGWLFMDWSGDLSGDYSTSNTTLLVDSTKSITATFSDDADDDGLLNTNELAIGTDPRDSDTDDDGFDDAYEVVEGLSPTNNNSSIVDYIMNNQSTFGLYTEEQLGTMAIGDLMIQSSNAYMNLWLQLMKSDDLVTWTNAGGAVEWSMPAGNKEFYKVRAEP